MKYLTQRGSIYQFERPVRKEVQSILGKKAWRESLNTDSRSEAEARCRKRTVETDEEMKAAEDGTLRLIPDEEIDWLAVQWSQYFQERSRENIPRDMFPDVFQDEPDIRESMGSTIFRSRRELEDNVIAWIELRDVKINVGSTDWTALIDECHAEYLTSNPEVSDQWFGVLQDRGLDLEERYRAAYKAAPRSVRVNPASTLSAVFKKYLDNSDLGQSAIDDFGVGVRRFKELHGDMPINDIDRRKVEEFRDSLQRLASRPPNAVRAMPITEQIAWAEGLDIKKLGQAAVNKNMLSVKLTLQYGFEQTSLIDDRNWRNPFDGFLKKPKAPEKTIKPFSEEQIKAVFSKEAFQPKSAEHFWIPLILFYTGARLDEISQLHVSDIKYDMVPHIETENLYDEDKAIAKKVKNISSNRTIPIHRDLVSLGLLDYHAEMVRQGQKHLFPGLPHAQGGKRGNAISRRFMRLFREYGKAHPSTGLDTTSLVTHSLRHSFRHFAFTKLDQEFVQVVMGHYVGGVSFQTYGAGIYKMPDVLAERVMDRIILPRLDLKYLGPMSRGFLPSNSDGADG